MPQQLLVSRQSESLIMPEVSLARNADINTILNNGIVAVAGAFDVCFMYQNCTAFKLQGSLDAGATYNDIAGSSTLFGASGTLTAGTTYSQSLTRCRFDHIKAIFSGSNPTCVVARRFIRQSPTTTRVLTVQNTIIDPVAGTA